jgi:PAS domain S-box-containing protein
LIGQNPRVLKSGETSAEEYRDLWSTIRTGEWRGTFHNRKKNGELFWEAAVIRPIRDPSGAPTHYLAVKEDITARKATEEALRASQERFRIAAENAGDAVFEYDFDTGRFDFVGASIHERFPLIRPPADIAEFLGMVHPDDVSQVTAAVGSHLLRHAPLREEYRIVQTDNSILDVAVRATIVCDAETRKCKSIGVISDITARKAAERSNAELAAIVESADAAILSRDSSGKVVTWNAGAEHVYGYTAEEMIGRNVEILFPADRAREDKEITDTVGRGQSITHLETVRINKRGEPVPVLLSASPIRNRAGEVMGTAYVVWDMTQLKLLQQQLAQAQKLESLGQLAAGIAHEINTPVQYIGDNVQFLSDAFQDLFRVIEPQTSAAAVDVDVAYLRGEIPKAIAQMQEGVDRVAGIVRAMKRFSHPGPAEKIPADINQAIESTVLVSRNEWKYVADLTTEFDAEMPPVPCIIGEFNQVILNLIVNATHAITDVVKASGGKGEIRISTRKKGDFAEIRVSDTGGGIPEAIQSKVFDPFFTTKAVGKGTGQGLAIAHSVIVQKHRGTIRFESETGKGTTFVIQLPLAEETEAKQ